MSRARLLPRCLSTAALVVVLAIVAACVAPAAAGPASPTVGPLGTAPAAAPSAPTGLPNAATGGGDPSPRASASPSPATPTAAARPVATPSSGPLDPFAIDLYRRGDFVAQFTFEWCVGASIQMTLAMTNRSDDMSRAAQQRLWEMARDRSFSPFGGANPRGWVATLNELGVGPYELVSVPDRDGALRVAARALVATGRPVGLVMWRGRHAWMMSGFESLGDPRSDAGFQVTGVRVLDPLYPHGSSRWGRSPKPNSLLTPAELGRQYVARTSGRVNLGVPPGYLLVLPRNPA